MMVTLATLLLPTQPRGALAREMGKASKMAMILSSVVLVILLRPRSSNGSPEGSPCAGLRITGDGQRILVSPRGALSEAAKATIRINKAAIL